MSEDPTKDIGEKYDTKPTIETLLEEVRTGFARVEQKLEEFDVRLDRIASDASKTRSDMLELRADFKEFRAEIRERLKETA